MRFRLGNFILTFLLLLSVTFGAQRTIVLPGTLQGTLGGTNWNPAGEETQMTSEDNLNYIFQTVLPIGNYEYKVAIDGSWAENYGLNGEANGQNIKFSVKNGYTKVTFHFNYETKQISQELLEVVDKESFKKFTPKLKEEEILKENILLKTDEYIEKSDSETLFLFKTPINAKIDFYIAEKGKPLIKTISNLSNNGKGLTATNLSAGKTYNYKIISTYMGKTLESPIESFTKEDLKFYKDRPEWAKDAIFYEVFVRSFYDSTGDKIGDFKGLKDKLSYLKDLGVTALWLMPINSSPSYHGYDVLDYKNLNNNFGSLEDFKSLLSEAKKLNIKIIMDFVLNHTSSSHPWFIDARSDENSPYRNYYIWADPTDNTKKLGDWGQTVWHKYNGSEYYGVFWGGMPDLNYRNKNLRNEIKDATKFWLNLGVDGFRLDASRYIDTNEEVTQLWWHDFNSYVKSINKDAFIVGENWDNSIDFVGKFINSMDSSFNFSLRDNIISMAKGSDVSLIDEIFLRNSVYSKENPNFIDSLFIGNHDMTRVASELQGDIQKQKYAMSILLTLPGTPFIYYGEEIGLYGTKPDENLREPMDWYKKASGPGMTEMKVGKIKYTKSSDGISVEEQNLDKNSLLNYTKKLIKIRKDNPAIYKGTIKPFDLGKKVNAYTVSYKENSLIIIHNSNSNSIKFGNITINGFSTAIIKNGSNLLEN